MRSRFAGDCAAVASGCRSLPGDQSRNFTDMAGRSLPSPFLHFRALKRQLLLESGLLSPGLRVSLFRQCRLITRAFYRKHTRLILSAHWRRRTFIEQSMNCPCQSKKSPLAAMTGGNGGHFIAILVVGIGPDELRHQMSQASSRHCLPGIP